MDPASGLAATKAAVDAAQLAYKGWGWLTRRWYGTITITHPQNRGVVYPEWVELEGTHNNPKRGHFWLFTVRGQEYWPQTRINLHPDGHWKERINASAQPGPRTCVVLLVWVSTFVDSLLSDIKDRSSRAQYWGPIKMSPPSRRFSVVQSLVLSVETRPTAR